MHMSAPSGSIRWGSIRSGRKSRFAGQHSLGENVAFAVGDSNGEAWYAMQSCCYAELMRPHAVQERRKLIKEMTSTAKGSRSETSTASGSDACHPGRASSIPPLMPDAQTGDRGGEGDLSVDLGALSGKLGGNKLGGNKLVGDASALSGNVSGNKLVGVPHWGGVVDTTKAALKHTADKERALNEKLAKVRGRGV